MVQNDPLVFEAAQRGDLPVQEQQRLLTLVDRFYPRKSGMIRRVHHVWGEYLRINFHDMNNENKIAESHFVGLGDTGDKLVELN